MRRVRICACQLCCEDRWHRRPLPLAGARLASGPRPTWLRAQCSPKRRNPSRTQPRDPIDHVVESDPERLCAPPSGVLPRRRARVGRDAVDAEAEAARPGLGCPGGLDAGDGAELDDADADDATCRCRRGLSDGPAGAGAPSQDMGAGAMGWLSVGGWVGGGGVALIAALGVVCTGSWGRGGRACRCCCCVR